MLFCTLQLAPVLLAGVLLAIIVLSGSVAVSSFGLLVMPASLVRRCSILMYLMLLPPLWRPSGTLQCDVRGYMQDLCLFAGCMACIGLSPLLKGWCLTHIVDTYPQS